MVKDAESEQQRSFRLRLARVAARAETGMQTLYLGPEETVLVPRRRSGPLIARGPIWLGAVALWQVVAPVICGALGHGLAMGLRRHLPQWPERLAPDLLAQGLCGLALAVLAAALLPPHRPARRLALCLLGLAIGMTAFALLPRILPQTAGVSLLWLGILSNP